VVVDCFGRRVHHGFRPVKRRRALLESNPPRNSRLDSSRTMRQGASRSRPFAYVRGRPAGGGGSPVDSGILIWPSSAV
jgi:hypothetical protein